MLPCTPRQATMYDTIPRIYLCRALLEPLKQAINYGSSMTTLCPLYKDISPDHANDGVPIHKTSNGGNMLKIESFKAHF